MQISEYEEILSVLRDEIDIEMARCSMDITVAKREGRHHFSNYLGMATLKMMKNLIENRDMAQYRKTFNMIEGGDGKAIRRFANGSK